MTVSTGINRDVTVNFPKSEVKNAIKMAEKPQLSYPCHLSWNSLEKDSNERSRHCSNCQKTVFDFRNMTSEQISNELMKNNGPICGYFYIKDVSIAESDWSAMKSRKRKRLMRLFAGNRLLTYIMLIALSMSFILSGCLPRKKQRVLGVPAPPKTNVNW